jgi:adenine-specific DNA-methyltransferase
MILAHLERHTVPCAAAATRDGLREMRTLSRALARRAPESQQLALARAFGSRVVQAWWREIMGHSPTAPALREPGEAFETSPLLPSMRRLADDIGAAAAEFDDEIGAYEIGLAYTGMLPDTFRGKHGAYYTPPSLAARLISLAGEAGADWATARVLDPACGGGAFLVPVARQMIAARPMRQARESIAGIASCLRGQEIDPFAAWLSQVALDLTLAPLARAAGVPAPSLVTIGDSLRGRPPACAFDLVIGNPPYGRVTLMDAERLHFSRGLYGHANLYGLFTDLALRHCKADGLIAYVTPTSFLGGEYFKRLRGLVGREAPPIAIDFVAARKGVFEDVLQETLLATYRKGAESGRVKVSQITASDDDQVVARNVGETRLPSDTSCPWFMPRAVEQASVVARLAEMPDRLAHWGWSVSTGPLVWNRHKSQLTGASGGGRFPVIWAEAVGADGAFRFKADRRNHLPYFAFRRGDDWLLISEACILVQRTTAKEQARRLVAAALPGDFVAEHGSVVVENHLNMLRPTRPSQVPPDVLAAFINSAAADAAFRCVSGSVAVSAYELEALPLPPAESLGELTRLVRRGGGKPEIEAVCARLYEGGR